MFSVYCLLNLFEVLAHLRDGLLSSMHCCNENMLKVCIFIKINQSGCFVK